MSDSPAPAPRRRPRRARPEKVTVVPPPAPSPARLLPSVPGRRRALLAAAGALALAGFLALPPIALAEGPRTPTPSPGPNDATTAPATPGGDPTTSPSTPGDRPTTTPEPAPASQRPAPSTPSSTPPTPPADPTSTSPASSPSPSVDHRDAAAATGFMDGADLARDLTAYRSVRGLGAVTEDPALLPVPPASMPADPGITALPGHGRTLIALGPAVASTLSAAVASDPRIAGPLEQPGLRSVAVTLSPDRTLLLIVVRSADTDVDAATPSPSTTATPTPTPPATSTPAPLTSSAPAPGAPTPAPPSGAPALQAARPLVPPTAAGSFPLWGAIGAYYASNPGARAELGSPTSGEQCGYRGGGCIQYFQGGQILWSPGTGAMHLRSGGIDAFYLASGGPSGAYGYPIGPVTRSAVGLNGWSVSSVDPVSGSRFRLQWSDDTGTVPVLVSGGIGNTWERDVTRYGYPRGIERCGRTGVCGQQFSAAMITWSGPTGPHALRAGFLAHYASQGGIDGGLGAPADDERATARGGSIQHFVDPRSGWRTALLWNPLRDQAVPVLDSGAIAGRWAASGAESGALGFPSTPETGGLARGGSSQEFEKGIVLWSPATGAWSVLDGPIRTSWERAGGAGGAWGYPTSALSPDGTRQAFENGVVSRSPDGSARLIGYGFDAEAAAAGLGAAQGGPWQVMDGVRAQRYAHGVVVHTLTYGAVAMDAPVFENWRSHPDLHGLPVRSERFGPSLQTRCEIDRLAYDGRLADVVRTDISLGAGDVLTIGDSQVWDGSWVGRGLTSAGLHPVFYRMGGIGYVNSAGTSFGSYHDGVIDDYWALPQGDPGYIYIGGSGNDVYVHDDARVAREATEVIRDLRRRYPRAVIVVGGVVSMDRPEAAPRWAMDDLLGRVAREQGATFLSMRGWITRNGAEGYLVDGLHFSVPAGQEFMAPVFRDGFRRVTGR